MCVCVIRKTEICTPLKVSVVFQMIVHMKIGELVVLNASIHLTGCYKYCMTLITLLLDMGFVGV